MIKEVTTNNFDFNTNKTNETPPVLQLKEIISNTFSLVINKEEVIPPIQTDNLDEALKDYTAKLEHIKKCIQVANESFKKNIGSNLEGKIINVIGDSITYGVNSNKSWTQYLQEDTGCVIRNYGISGASIGEKSGADNSNAFVNRFANMDNNADIVIVFGGTNDFGNSEGITTLGKTGDAGKETVYGAVDFLIKGLINKYDVKTKIVFLLPTMRNYYYDNAEYAPNSKGYTLQDVRDAIKTVCYSNGIKTLDLKDCGVNPYFEKNKNYYITDGIHPVDEGQKLIKTDVRNFLESLF